MPPDAYLMQPSFAAGEVSADLYARVDIAKYHVALRTCRNFIVHATGGASNRGGSRFVGEVKDSTKYTRLIPFVFSNLQAYALEFGNLYMRVISAGGYVLETTKNILDVSAADPAVVEVTAHGYSNGDRVFIADVVGPTQVNGRYFSVANVTADTFEILGFAQDTTGAPAYVSGGTVARVFTLVTPYLEAHLNGLKFVQSADVMTIVEGNYAPRDLKRLGHANWTLTTITFATSQAAPTSPTATPTDGASAGITHNIAQDYDYVITALATGTFEESVASAVATASHYKQFALNGYIDVDWVAAAGAARYNVYKRKNGLFGLIGQTDALTFRDDNINPDMSQAPPIVRDPFAASNWPFCVTYFDERRIFGGSFAQIQTLWATQVGVYNNMNVSEPVRDDDAIEKTIISRRVQEIRNLVPLNYLVVLTSGGEWKAWSGTASDVITPSAFPVKQQSEYGCAHAQPVVVGSSIIYARVNGGINEIRISRDDYGGGTFETFDRSVLSSHLTDGQFLFNLSWQQDPHKIVWMTRPDGVLLGMTYHQEHDVYAWHRHDTDGVYESVISIPEGNEDAVYAIVRRTIDGVSKRYVERMQNRVVAPIEDAWFVDCGLQHDGAPVSTIGGLEHLEGKTVSVLADGAVHAQKVVADGVITLDAAASNVIVGLPYVSDIETLDVDTGQPTTQGRTKKVTAVTALLINSRGLMAGPSVDQLTELKPRTNEPYGSPPGLKTGKARVILDPSWDTTGRLCFRQTLPLPVTISGIIPELAFGD